MSQNYTCTLEESLQFRILAYFQDQSHYSIGPSMPLHGSKYAYYLEPSLPTPQVKFVHFMGPYLPIKSTKSKSMEPSLSTPARQDCPLQGYKSCLLHEVKSATLTGPSLFIHNAKSSHPRVHDCVFHKAKTANFMESRPHTHWFKFDYYTGSVHYFSRTSLSLSNIKCAYNMQSTLSVP